MQSHNAALASTSTTSFSDELHKLAQLRDDGILTDAEFTEAKQKLLAAM